MIAAPAAVLRVENLQTRFSTARGVVRAVDGVSIELRPHRVLALLGESGSGKTMTGLSIIRLVPEPGRIVGGHVWFKDRDLLGLDSESMRELRGSGIAMVFQNPRDRLDPAFTIEAQLAEVLRLHRVSTSRAAARARCLELLAEVQIPEPERVLKSHPHELSGGLLQRVMIAMALSASPDILVADEPTSSLDVTIQSEILDLLATLQRTRGMSVLFITHDIQVARQVADEVAIMYGGHIVERGRADEVLDRPLHPYTQALLQCVPRVTESLERLNTISGQPLNLRELPPGCRFAPRCPYVQERCRHAVPPLLPVKEREVRCVLYEEPG
jgi:peptide/nickel transport system ATP-binding protein/oligopeptide transport system ATP-binding protein